MKTFISALLLILFFNCSYSQTAFTKYYDSGNESLKGIVSNVVATPDSGFIWTTKFGYWYDADSYANITKCDKNGNIVWSNLNYDTWNGIFFDVLNANKVALFRTFIMPGNEPEISFIDIPTGATDTFKIIRLKKFCPPGGEGDLDFDGYHTLDVKKIDSNSLIILTDAKFQSCGGSRSALFRFNINDSIPWIKVYNGILSKLLISNDTIICSGNSDICAFDLNGNLLWSKKWVVPVKYLTALNKLGNGKFIASGTLTDATSFLAEVSNSGNISWIKKYSSDSSISLQSVIEINNTLYVVGNLQTPNSPACLLRLNSAGEVQNSYKNINRFKGATTIIKGMDNSLIIGGYTTVTEPINDPYSYTKLRPSICKFYPNAINDCWINYNVNYSSISLQLLNAGKTVVNVSNFPSDPYPYNSVVPASHFDSVLCSSTVVTGCEPPQYQYANNISNTGASISWSSSSNAVKYRLQFRKTGTTTWTQYILSGNSYNLNNLLPNTAYQYRVRSVCSANGSVLSPWCSIKTFTTTNVNSGCVTPQNMVVTLNSNSSAAISWAAQTGIVNYQLRVRAVGNATWTVYVIAGSLNSKTITSLVPNTPYQFQIRTQCTSGSFTPFTSLQTFNTPLRLEEEVATQESESLLIYPNPTKDLVNIITNCNSCNLRVFDLQGRIILERNPDADNFSINISDWALGIYLIEVENENEIQRGKLIKE